LKIPHFSTDGFAANISPEIAINNTQKKLFRNCVIKILLSDFIFFFFYAINISHTWALKTH
jgi:hypothetical protein